MLGLYWKSLARTSVITATEQNQCENETHAARPFGSRLQVALDDGEPIDASLCGIPLSVRSGPERRDCAGSAHLAMKGGTQAAARGQGCERSHFLELGIRCFHRERAIVGPSGKLLMSLTPSEG
jgi:hypothetical protein